MLGWVCRLRHGGHHRHFEPTLLLPAMLGPGQAIVVESSKTPPPLSISWLAVATKTFHSSRPIFPRLFFSIPIRVGYGQNRGKMLVCLSIYLSLLSFVDGILLLLLSSHSSATATATFYRSSNNNNRSLYCTGGIDQRCDLFLT